MKPQTTVQILRCLILGRYTASIEGGELKIRGPQPLAGPLPASIKARRDELVACLSEHCGGTWPAAPGSALHAAYHANDNAAATFTSRLRERRNGKEHDASKRGNDEGVTQR